MTPDGWQTTSAVSLCVVTPQAAASHRLPVGAENAVTLRDLGILVDQAAEPVPTLNVQCWFRRVDGCRVPKLRRML